jgi:hypothetical protein
MPRFHFPAWPTPFSQQQDQARKHQLMTKVILQSSVGPHPPSYLAPQIATLSARRISVRLFTGLLRTSSQVRVCTLSQEKELLLSSRTKRGGLGWTWVRDLREAICLCSPSLLDYLTLALSRSASGFLDLISATAILL